jgi:hypothetical protein
MAATACFGDDGVDEDWAFSDHVDGKRVAAWAER